MRVAEDSGVILDDKSPASAGAPSRNDSFGDQADWLSRPGHAPNQTGDQGADRRTPQGHAQADYKIGGTNSSGYGNGDSSNSADPGLSPDTGHSGSNRPTPNSTTPSETRSGLHPGSTTSRPSYNSSPVASHQRTPATEGSMSTFFTTYSNIPETDFTPDGAFTRPETPGKEFPVPNGWEMSAQTTGLTPVGEGVFRHLMELGPIDPMDLGWEEGS